eukprot:2253986-Pleurochrysis_carterae.AAC.1
MRTASSAEVGTLAGGAGFGPSGSWSEGGGGGWIGRAKGGWSGGRARPVAAASAMSSSRWCSRAM